MSFFKKDFVVNAAGFFLFLSIPLSIFSGLILAPVLIIFFALALIHGGYKIKLNLPIILSIVFYIWALLSYSWSVEKSYILESWLRSFALFMFGIVTIYFFDALNKKHKEKLSAIMVAGFIASLLFIIEEVVTGGFIAKGIRYAISGFSHYSYESSDMNRGACFVAIIFWPAILIFSRITKSFMLSFLLWLITGTSLLFLESLSSIIGYFSASFVFAAVYIFRAKKVIYFISIITTLVLIGVPFISTKYTPELIVNKLSFIPPSAIHRVYIWDFASNKATESSILGIGFNSSRYVEGAGERLVVQGYEQFDLWTKLPLHPHNNIIQTWLELGIIGVVSLLGIIFAVFRKIQTSKLSISEKSIATSTLVSYLAIATMGFGAWQHWWMATAYISIIYVLLSISFRRSASKQN